MSQVTYVRAVTLTSSDITGVPVRESEGQREKVEQEALEIITAEEFPCCPLSAYLSESLQQKTRGLAAAFGHR